MGESQGKHNGKVELLPSRPVYPECQVEFHSELGGKRGSTDSSGEVLRTGSQLCWQRTITHTTQAADILP